MPEVAARSLRGAVVHDMPARVLRITRVWDALDVHPSVDEAVAAALTAAGRTGP
ncbi:hypothetical protein [Nonomuraea phyllanthi]|uniref:hypothetical protein n=1 Tax=Nonomuraea phyllanthi TaxID=2219224 RepID=UPI001D029058|nr:hypothetical protein [Nonomuraea phyllanthi]